jgi:ATP-dependent Clp protease protease subunit
MATGDTLKEATALLLEHDIDIVSRVIYLTEEINEHTINHIVKAIRYLSMLDAEAPINLHICSPGGDVGEMFHLYDVMRRTKCPIWTYGYGIVASAAVPILAAGDKRFGNVSLKIMIHQASQWMPDAYTNEQVSAAIAGQEFQREMFKILERHTKKTASFLEKVAVDRGQVWIDASKSKEWGIVDEIMQPVLKKKVLVKKKIPVKKRGAK